jgi:acetolactate synthase-1/2/3 large subunit
MKAAEYVIKGLIREGITHIFFVPGGTLDPLLMAAEKLPEIQLILSGHEGCAVFLADGYAKVSGNFGVAMGVAGPGITNMVTGIAEAYCDQTPLLIISGNVKTAVQGRGAFQDSSVNGINDQAILSSITSKQVVISHVNLVKPHLNKLLRSMLGHSSRGPVQLSFPIDIQSQDMPNDSYQPISATMRQPRFVDEVACQTIWPKLKGMTKVVIYAGNGTVISKATDELVKFAEQFEIPIVTTLAAKGIIPEDHRLSMGVLGWYGNRYATDLIINEKPEVLIVLGTRLNQTSGLALTKDILPSKTFIINDIDESHISGDHQPDIFVLGDAREFLHYLNNAEQRDVLLKTKAARQHWLNEWLPKSSRFYDDELYFHDKLPVHPARVAHEMRRVLPKDTILFSGEGAGSFIISHYWTCYGPGQFFTPIRTISPMGWGIAAAMGGKLANPKVPVVSITGEGTMLMHGTEIQTAARYNVPVIFVVINNHALGPLQLRAQHMENYKAEFLKIPTYDWVKFAESFGITGFLVEHPEQLAPTFEKALKLNKPVLIDIQCCNYQTPTYAYDYYTFGFPWPEKYQKNNPKH